MNIKDFLADNFFNINNEIERLKKSKTKANAYKDGCGNIFVKIAGTDVIVLLEKRCGFYAVKPAFNGSYTYIGKCTSDSTLKNTVINALEVMKRYQ